MSRILGLSVFLIAVFGFLFGTQRRVTTSESHEPPRIARRFAKQIDRQQLQTPPLTAQQKPDQNISEQPEITAPNENARPFHRRIRF